MSDIKNPMLGAIVGDIVGSRFEFKKETAEKDFELFTKDCRFTDDTVLTLAVAKAIKESYSTKSGKEIRNTIRDSMYDLCDNYPDAGYGRGFFMWLLNPKKEPYGSMGNGCIMRCSSAGYYARSLTEAKNLGYLSSVPTHDHPIGAITAVYLSAAIWMALNGDGKDAIYNFISEEIDLEQETDINSVLAMDTFVQAIKIFNDANSFEECLREAVMMGGDTDTRAAAVCSLAGAYYGVPTEMADHVRRYLTAELNDILVSVSSKDE